MTTVKQNTPTEGYLHWSITTVAELIALTPEELSKLPYMGKTTLRRVVDVLSELGLSLKSA